MKKYLLTILLLVASLATAQVASLPSNADWKPTGAVMGYYPPNDKYYVLPINASGALIVDAGEEYLEVDEFDVLVTKDDRDFQAPAFLIGGADALTASGTDWIALGGLGITQTNLFGSVYLNETPMLSNVGTRNVVVGDSFNTTTTGSSNTVVGEDCASIITSGSYNTALGSQVLSQLTSGASNTAVGQGSLFYTNTGSYNTAVGVSALGDIRGSSSNNTAIGWYAGRSNPSTANQTLNNGVYLGYKTRSLSDNVTNEIVIGYDAQGHGDNTVTIGSSSVTLNYFSGTMNLSNVPEYADNAAASAGGLASGTFYHTAGVLKIVY